MVPGGSGDTEHFRIFPQCPICDLLRRSVPAASMSWGLSFLALCAHEHLRVSLPRKAYVLQVSHGPGPAGGCLELRAWAARDCTLRPGSPLPGLVLEVLQRVLLWDQ